MVGPLVRFAVLTMSAANDPRTIRNAAGLSQLAVAAKAHTSLHVVRLFEANPDAVSAPKRAALAPIYAELAAGIGAPQRRIA